MSAMVGTLSANDVTMFDIGSRNEEAQKIIASYATNHAWLDVAVGVVGTLIPGAALPAMAACIAAQGPLFYKPMAADLGKVYLRLPDEQTGRIVNQAEVYGAGAFVGVEFGMEFFKEIAGELISDIGWGAAATFIPLVGGVVGAALDATVAATLTWRVGTMVSMYYQNGGAWLGSRHATYERAKLMVGPMSPAAENRVKLDDVPLKNKEVLDQQFSRLKAILLDSILEMATNEQMVVQLLRKRGISEALIQLAIPYIQNALRRRT
jgi:uncharacterized protein (DUF697 family)